MVWKLQFRKIIRRLEIAEFDLRESYDADNMVLEKLRDDLFRHWFLGLGTGDLLIRPYGPQQEVIQIPNVFLLGSKVHRIEHMIATQPER